MRKASFLDRLIIEFAPDILVLPVVQNRREEERREEWWTGNLPEVAKKGYSTLFQKLRKSMVLVFCNLAKNVRRVNL